MPDLSWLNHKRQLRALPAREGEAVSDHDCGPLDPCPVCEAEKDAYDQGRADERAAVVAWLREKAHDPTWLRGHGVQSRQGVDALEEASDCIKRGEHLPEEVKP